MRKCMSLLGFAVLILLSSLVLAPRAEAYETYHDPSQDGTGYCADCHPSFAGRGALHDLHQGSSAFTNTCNLCHTGNTRNNPFTMWSIGTGPQEEKAQRGQNGRTDEPLTLYKLFGRLAGGDVYQEAAGGWTGEAGSAWNLASFSCSTLE